MDQEEGELRGFQCESCGYVGLEESDGFYYCQQCGAQAQGIMETGVADEDFVDKGPDTAALYSHRHIRRSQSTRSSQPTADPSSIAWLSFTQEEAEPNNDNNNNNSQNYIKREDDYGNDYIDSYDGVFGPTEPEDFGGLNKGKLSYEDYYNEVRIRYVLGMGFMIRLQCEALVEKFNVTPLIVGVASTVWLRFLLTTGVFKDNWANDVLIDSEMQKPETTELAVEPEDEKSGVRYYRHEPRNSFGQRAVLIWFRYLRKEIPLHYSLAISFLACHVAREAVLPTDIVKWSVEGKLPYFDAHVEIEKQFGHSSPACRISSSLMFRPMQPVPMQKLESVAAGIADSIGLHLPPVYFYGIASRYLRQLSLPVEKILPHACRIYEWSMPPDLWFSTNELRLPSRVCVLSILIVAIRIIYNINGFGAWEGSLSGCISRLDSPCSSQMRVDDEKDSGSHKLDDSDEKSVSNRLRVQMSELDSQELLHNLDAKYNEISDTYEFTRDLPSYLQYCKDVVFSGAGSSHMTYREDELIDKLWDFYQSEKYSDPAEDNGAQNRTVLNGKRSRNDDGFAKDQMGKRKIRDKRRECLSTDTCNSTEDENSENEDDSTETVKDKAIRKLKLDMAENRFSYIPPRLKVKRFNYLHYVRKLDDGALTYVAHADYYILLRAFARAAQVDTRIMHIGVLNFERRVDWMEKRVDYCLHLTPPSFNCEYCRDLPDHSDDDDAIGLSQLHL
ncbi:unnamed protein product [Dovyalis caffra]|uniref:Rrn7/TAF1B N-terminal cyclin domain-containing protein n=1 Tax=Dovyalis caffra TaxID=77055 RepID=A0AAV1QWJ1_9ROSI|nr:unnamed protein product [Dovyalis caffra]